MKKENTIIGLLLLPSILVLFMLAFELSIVDIISVFLIAPVMWAGWALLLVSTAISVALLFFNGRAKKLKFYLPILAFAVTLFCTEFVPFTDIWLKANFFMYRTERERVASDIFSAKLRPNVSYNQSLISLPTGCRYLSMGGGEVELWHFVGDDSGVFFFTFRGILGSSEGYLFMNSDTVPSGGETMQVEKIAPRWFFVQTE